MEDVSLIDFVRGREAHQSKKHRVSLSRLALCFRNSYYLIDHKKANADAHHGGPVEIGRNDEVTPKYGWSQVQG